MSKKNRVRNHESPVEKGPKMIRADRLVCGDRVPMSKSVLTVDDIEVRGLTRIVTLAFDRGGSIDVTYGCNELVEIQDV